MEDFTAGTTHNQPARRESTIDPPFSARVQQLVADWGAEKSPELIEEMIITALKMARDKMGTGDLKLMNRSLKEMRYAAKVFSNYRAFRKVCDTAGIGMNWSPRELRHTFVSIMSEQGVPVEEIARLVGHSTTATTEAVYRRELRPVISPGAEVMDTIFKIR